MTSSIVVMFALMFTMSIFSFYLQTRARPPPGFPVLCGFEYILYPWGAICHRVSGSISSFSHVLETAWMLISCCIGDCWKSVNFGAKDLTFICERFSLNLSGIYLIFLILLVLTSHRYTILVGCRYNNMYFSEKVLACPRSPVWFHHWLLSDA